MRHETKIALAVRDDLPGWQRLNVTAFLAGGLAAAVEGSTGAPFEDADGNRYLPLIAQPVLVHSASAGALARARAKALDRGLRVGVYTEALFGTDNDEANRAEVHAVRGDALDLVGIAVYGPRNAVSAALKGIPLHT